MSWSSNNNDPYYTPPSMQPVIDYPTKKKSRGCNSCLVSLLVLVLIAGVTGSIFYFSGAYDDIMGNFTSEQGASGGVADLLEGMAASDLDMAYSDMALVADLDGDENPELAVSLWERSNSTFNAALLDGATGKVLWEQPLGNTDSVDYLGAGDVVIAVQENSMRAFDAKTGTERWSVRLSDRVATYQQEGIWATNDRLVVHTYDNVLTAYELATGLQVAQHTLRETSPQSTARIGDDLCTSERNDENLEYLQCFELATLTPRDPIPLGLDWTESVFWTPTAAGEQPSYLRAYADADPPRIERVTFDGTVLAQRELDSDFMTIIDFTYSYVSNGSHAAVVKEDRVAIFGNDGTTADVFYEDDQLYPMMLGDGLLVLGHINQRGTQKLSLLGIDTATGAERWRATDLIASQYGIRLDDASWLPLRDGGLAFGSDSDTDLVTVLVLNPDGTVRWRDQFEPFISQKPKMYQSGVRLYVYYGDRVTVFNVADGSVVWSSK